MKLSVSQQLVLDKLAEGWTLHSSPYYTAPVWLSTGKGGRQDPYRTIRIRRGTLEALLKKKIGQI